MRVFWDNGWMVERLFGLMVVVDEGAVWRIRYKLLSLSYEE